MSVGAEDNPKFQIPAADGRLTGFAMVPDCGDITIGADQQQSLGKRCCNIQRILRNKLAMTYPGWPERDIFTYPAESNAYIRCLWIQERVEVESMPTQ